MILGGEITEEIVRAWISDTGPGIPAAYLPHIFERFYQIDPSRERRNRGSGLGLAIALEIARMHGEGISIQSEPGKGTTFMVYLKVRLT